MTGPLLVLLSIGALGASLALLTARLGWDRLADAFVVAAVLGGLASFALVAGFTLRRARQIDRGARP